MDTEKLLSFTAMYEVRISRVANHHLFIRLIVNVAESATPAHFRLRPHPSFQRRVPNWLSGLESADVTDGKRVVSEAI
jgi:hypothetical protein